MARVKNKIGLVSILLCLSSCSSYKSTWDCPKETGIGCSSIEYADEVAKEQIILNHSKEGIKTILLHQDEIKEVEIVG